MTERIKSIQNKLEPGEALVVMGDANRLYFTGFRSSAGTLLITRKSAHFLIDFRYFENAANRITHCDIVLAKDLYVQIRELLNRDNVEVVYTETSYIHLAQFTSLQNNLSDFTFSSAPKMDEHILKLRSIKNTDEIKNIKLAQKITDDTFDYILERISAGRTEREIMLDMEFYLRKQGSEGVAFDFIVVSGKNSSVPHGVPTDKKIEAGDFITMDFGAVINGYRSDMTRTIALGKVNDEQRHVYETVLEAQKKAFNKISIDTPCIEVDRVAREHIAKAGYDGCFGHGLGHSVGIEVHESPLFNTRDCTLLKPGMVLSVEPGIYLPGKFGVRIEDLVVITESGYQNITNSPKKLIEL